MVLWQGLTEGGTAVPVQVTEAGKVVAEGQEGKEGPIGPIGPPGPQGEYGPGDDVDLGTITAEGDITTEDAFYNGVTLSSDNSRGVRPSVFINGYNSSSTSNSDLAFRLRIWDELTPPGVGRDMITMDYGGSIIAGGPITTSTGNVAINPNPTTPGCTLHEGGQLYLSRVPDNSTAIYIYKTGEIEPAIRLNNNGEITAAGNKAGFTANGELYFTSRGTRYKLEVAGGLCNAVPFTREMELRERVENKRKPRPTDSVPED